MRWHSYCNGCPAYSKLSRPWPRAAGDLVLAFDTVKPDDHESRDLSWHVPGHLQRAELAPLLRCPGFVRRDDLIRSFRGEKALVKRQGACQGQALVSAKRLIVLGEQALKAAVRDRLPVKADREAVKFNDLWGSILTLGDQEIYVASNWTDRFCPADMLEVDYHRTRDWLNNRLVVPPDAPYKLLTPKEAYQLLDRRDPRLPVAADIETAGGVPGLEHSGPVRNKKKDGLAPNTGHLRCIGFGWQGKTYMVAEFNLDGTRRHSRTHMTKFLPKLLERPTIWHNAGFDLGWLEHLHGVRSSKLVHDTMLMHRHTNEECPHSLAVACALLWYTGSWKVGLAHGMNARTNSILWQYCAQDVANTWRLWVELTRALRGL